ncbi:MAG: hypothetical protein ACM3SQ_05745 [Betaproteobacteria bacterium]
MEATRTRPSFAGEWLAAAAFLVATLVVGLLVVRELRMAPPPPVAAGEPASSADVPVDAVSVPAIMQGTPEEVKVGDRAEVALARVGAAAVLTRAVTKRGPLGARSIRSYLLGGTRFILVLEPFERNGEARVAGIYLQ